MGQRKPKRLLASGDEGERRSDGWEKKRTHDFRIEDWIVPGKTTTSTPTSALNLYSSPVKSHNRHSQPCEYLVGLGSPCAGLPFAFPLAFALPPFSSTLFDRERSTGVPAWKDGVRPLNGEFGLGTLSSEDL
jgi:hypothetical protein